MFIVAHGTLASTKHPLMFGAVQGPLNQASIDASCGKSAPGSRGATGGLKFLIN